MDHSEHAGLQPYMHLIEDLLRGLVDGEICFDLLAEDVVVEMPFAPLGHPKRLDGRAAVLDAWRRFGQMLTLRRMSDQVVYTTDRDGVAVLQYKVHGKGRATGRPYLQMHVSLVEIRDRRVVHWLDLSNPLVIMKSLCDPEDMAAGFLAEARA